MELNTLGVSDGCRRPLLHGAEMVEEGRCWSPKATAGLRAEAWDVRAHLLVFFFLVVSDLLGASVLGVGAGNHD